MKTVQDIQIGTFSVEDFKQDTPEGSAELRQMFGGVKLLGSQELFSSSSSSDLSDLEEDDGMIFRSTPFKKMSQEERKEFLDSEHRSFQKSIQSVQIESLWDFKFIPLKNDESYQKISYESERTEQTPPNSKIPTLTK
jgi:hypothetical protein